MRELEQEDVCDMEVNLAEVRWQESDAKVFNALAQELETVALCLPVDEEDEDMNMRDDDRRDGYGGEEQVPLEDGEQRDGWMANMEDGEQRYGSVPEREVHSRQDVERVKRALRNLLTKLRHPGAKEKIRVVKHGRASELAIQEAGRKHCDICDENVQPTLPRPTVPRQVLDFNERIGLDILSLPHWRAATRSVKCLKHCVSRDPVLDDHTTVVWNDGLGRESGVPTRLAAMGTPSQNKLSLTPLKKTCRTSS